jgi:hypothetical protein
MLATTVISKKAYRVKWNKIDVTVLARNSCDAILFVLDLFFLERK